MVVVSTHRQKVLDFDPVVFYLPAWSPPTAQNRVCYGILAGSINVSMNGSISLCVSPDSCPIQVVAHLLPHDSCNSLKVLVKLLFFF